MYGEDDYANTILANQGRNTSMCMGKTMLVLIERVDFQEHPHVYGEDLIIAILQFI